MTKCKFGIVALEASEIHLREREGGNFACMQKAGELADGGEGEIFNAGWAGDS